MIKLKNGGTGLVTKMEFIKNDFIDLISKSRLCGITYFK